MEKSKERLAFVDMEFHRKTRSGDFLREILSDNFEIHDFWHDGTRKCALTLMNDLGHFKYIFFFQSLMPYKQMLDLRKAGVKMIWAPMYDGLPMSAYFWSKIASLKIKVISFSSAITGKAKTHGIDYSSFRYFKKPLEGTIATRQNKGVNIFFWYRGNIQFNDWIRIARNLPINKIVYLPAPDPKFKSDIISEEDIKKYNIQIADHSFVKQEVYIEYVKDCDIFVCPRRQEGIGMTIVEALAMGKFLIGYKDYTMIDYIEHKKNGFLFDENTQEMIDIKDVESSAIFCNELRHKGYNEWIASQKRIADSFFEYKYPDSQTLSGSNIYFLCIEQVKIICKRMLGYKST